MPRAMTPFPATVFLRLLPVAALCAALALTPASAFAQGAAPAPARPPAAKPLPGPPPEPKVVPLPQRVGEPTEAEKAWGIEVLSLSLTASGSMIDMRYRVSDPEKAKKVLDKDSRTYVIHQMTGIRLDVPITKGGPMRQTARKVEKGRIYFVLFNNPAQLVAPGDKVTVVMADMKMENVVVR